MFLYLPLLLFIFNTDSITADNFHTVVLDGTYESDINLTINNTIEYVIVFKNVRLVSPSRVTVRSNNVSWENPISVVARQQKEVLSWQVPLLVDTRSGYLEFYETSRTLCPNNMDVLRNTGRDELIYYRGKSDYSNSTNESKILVSVSTSSEINTELTVFMEFEENFFIDHSVRYNVTITPSKPKYYFYKFESNYTENSAHSMVLHVNSNDDVCMLISIQNSSCPVYDLEHDIRFEGYWETVDKKGGITLAKDKFPNGFFLLFVSKSENYDCTGSPMKRSSTTQKKTLSFELIPSISYHDYMTAVLATVGAVCIFYVLFVSLLCLCSRGAYNPLTMDFIDQEITIPSPTTPSTVMGECMSPNYDDNSSMDETDYDTIAEAGSVRNFYRSKSTLCLNDLARKDPRILTKKSYLYLWHVLTVAVFYGLPVVQLVITYQRVLMTTGNQDLCYYNFLCAHPLGMVSDFNHIFSNIGYILLGILFLCLTYRRERMHKDSVFDRYYGIPQHYGLFYAMGVALMMEGVLSGSYHVCPNHSNFQFDTSFMYVMAVLIMVKLYQNRHPDINATAYSTFMVLAVAIFLGMVGIIDGSLYFRIAFTILHTTTCLVLTVQIYYLGCWKMDRGIFMRVFRTVTNDIRSGLFNPLIPVHKGRMILLIIANVCNWVVAVIGLKYPDKDFATHLLIIFMANTTLYTLFYIIMKLCHKEQIRMQAAIFIVLTFLTWGAATYFFVHKSISWALTPAQSRLYNQPCLVIKFYDPHDIWHFLSASAMFFSFMMLLTLDDDLTHVHRSKIPVF